MTAGPGPDLSMQEQIFDALRRGAHDEAVAAARAAIAAEPDAARAHLWLAMALNASGQRSEALATIDRGIVLAPEDASLHVQRAGLLLDARDLDAAKAALSSGVALDPNQFAAYVMQAQLALATGDIDEAERQGRLAARVAPDHPWNGMLEGLVALRRGDAARAVAVLARAAGASPDDPQLLNALGLAYLANGHAAFAEQVFRRLLERDAGTDAARILLARIVQQQARPGDAADLLQPLLDEARSTATAPLLRLAGQLDLAAGRFDRAIATLRRAVEADGNDVAAMASLAEGLRLAGDAEGARRMLDQALAVAPAADGLWFARVALEEDDDARDALVMRWNAVLPDSVSALEARMAGQARTGGDIDATAARILEREPGHGGAHLARIDARLRRDPLEAIAYIEALLPKVPEGPAYALFQSWLALARDRAGQYDAAAKTWLAWNLGVAPTRPPLPDPSPKVVQWPGLAPAAPGAGTLTFLHGLPGSRVEQVGAVFESLLPAFRSDRFGATAPADLFQHYATPGRLASGELSPSQVAESWIAALPSRGLSAGQAFDWLPFWHNAFLMVLRERMPHARLLFALRDPRDMLMDWFAHGPSTSFRIEGLSLAAWWLRTSLEQLAEIGEQSLFPHTLLRLDAVADDPAALAATLSEAMQVRVPTLHRQVLGVAHFRSGHWRKYAQVLAEPFAMLTPVAQRLGYPEN